MLRRVVSEDPKVVNFGERSRYKVSMILISEIQKVGGTTKVENLCFRRRELLR